MKSVKLRMICTSTFCLSIMGWVFFAIFFAPDGFFSSTQSPVMLSQDPLSPLYFSLFVFGLAVPILSLLGLVISVLLGIRELRT
jgi:hypothetical protein